MTQLRCIVMASLLLLGSGCTNSLYQGDLLATDAYGKQRHFVLYWTKTDPLLGMPKAGPAMLLTQCSPNSRISFEDQPEGVVFRGVPGYDRLPGTNATVGPDQTCGRVTNYASLAEAGNGPLSLVMYCRPLSPDDFAVEPRNYLAARLQPYTFEITEKIRRWSLRGVTLPAPQVPECVPAGK